ncbi:MAG: beta galactosidase jelly roll domain-containing protein, partial [Alicyclobacillaceae bacterium]|nr:beta galactosidase jelly roll domain-containing protein [Alicyclobacillaceae bacterium]
GHNDQLCRWVEEKVWWYRGRFTFDRGSLQEDEVVELVFEGLDTVATVYLNGRELGRHANMFVPAVFEVTRELADGDNVVAVKFDPVSLHVREKDLTLWSAFSRERVWIRKAQMHFGWDWGPRIVPCGIWRPVRLRRYRGVRIGSVFPRTVSVTDDRARVRVDVELEGPRAEEGDGALEVHVLLRDGDRLVAEAGWTVDQGRVSGELEVTGPKLWWTHDLGEPFLYRLEVSLRRGSLELDRQEQAVGIRTVELRMQEDGESRFLFVLNGWPLFAKGANWIPVDQFVGAAPDARYVRLLESARDAGMNMIRVWGGGIYERDVFYDTCDRLGLLVWQDFMFACALYPDFNRDFVHEVEREVNTVVRRLRGRTCLALWCGNNENEWIWEMMASDGRVRTPFYGERIYYDLIPRVLRRLDPDRPYWPSSPYGGNDHNSAEEGDRHNWQVWHGHVYPRRFGEPERVDYSVEGVSFKQYLR